ncbi:TPA: hypothetical protein DIC20_02910 [Candidatus Dependentiae bacterium]|nr:MAG: hypothetical protein US03_C0009G0037 [candidate division TM6 bacterium GW2011_GWF2_36_131]KKQ02876.1 MAG: hypothetical protein US13_C0009G0068 [candidate division TM6 bacterium GW2011_GWE2_36_25]KKQ19528.1 MAG: hypothetical protein US32_C0008G0029 [candidate division TM6 bacterium GW2011_GWA2_36_9]HBR70241.1 hypothetical protein [Candidatus Dependentiae bacterium]HCU00625.1 hypothetical protein [Candidatus Dependentiae bacterium]
MWGLKFLLLIFFISHLSAMKNCEEDFPDPKTEWWFKKLPDWLQKMTFFLGRTRWRALRVDTSAQGYSFETLS